MHKLKKLQHCTFAVISYRATAILDVNNPCANFITLQCFNAVNCFDFLCQFSTILSLQKLLLILKNYLEKY